MTPDDLRDPVMLGILEVSLQEVADVAADLAEVVEKMLAEFKGDGYVALEARQALQRLGDLGERRDDALDEPRRT